MASIVALRLRTTGVSLGTARREGRVGCRNVLRALDEHISGELVTMRGSVARTLPDSHGAYEHQRFIVACTGGRTVLVVNDVSIGRRVPVVAGSAVTVRGVYIWNRQGGLIHFTHHARGGGEGGWILYANTLYSAVVDNSPEKDVDKKAPIALGGGVQRQDRVPASGQTLETRREVAEGQDPALDWLRYTVDRNC